MLSLLLARYFKICTINLFTRTCFSAASSLYDLLNLILRSLRVSTTKRLTSALSLALLIHVLKLLLWYAILKRNGVLNHRFQNDISRCSRSVVCQILQDDAIQPSFQEFIWFSLFEQKVKDNTAARPWKSNVMLTHFRPEGRVMKTKLLTQLAAWHKLFN